MIPQEVVQKITEAANIVDVISDYVTLTKKGANFQCQCPFHNEKTASMVVSPAKGIFTCFGCGKKGDAVTFIREHDAVSYPQALEMLAKKYNIIIPKDLERTPEEKLKDERRGNILAALRFAVSYYQQNLVAPEAKEYIIKRDLTPDMIDLYQIGYASPTWDAFVTFAKRHGFNTDVLLAAGLISKSTNGYIDRFRGRLMFPFFDLNSNPIGFTGRIIVDQKDTPKYLNTEETEVFHKGKVIFGLLQARKHIAKLNNAYLAEGNIDVISLVKQGIPNVVCGSGTAFTPEQIRILKRFTENVVVVYDGDAAGEKALDKNTDLLLAEGMTVSAIVLPEGEDPDSFARKNTKKEIEAFFEKNCKDFITLKWIKLKEKTKGDVPAQTEAVKSILKTISLIPDEISKQGYIGSAVRTFGIKEKLVNDTLAGFKIKESGTPQQHGWIGLDADTEAAVKEESVLLLTDTMQSLIDMRSADKCNSITYQGKIDTSHIQQLRILTNTIIYDSEKEITDIAKINRDEVDIVILLKRFIELGFEVKIPLKNPETKDTSNVSFVEWYISKSKSLAEFYNYDSEWQTTLVRRSAELLSFYDITTQTLYQEKYAKELGVKIVDFKKVLKPFTDRRKTRATFQAEGLKAEDGFNFIFDDPKNLPEYVDRDLFQRWKYFAAQDSKGNKLFYVFQNENNGLINVANFYMEPLFHVYDPEPAYNMRIVRLFHSELYTSTYVELPSTDMMDFGAFRKLLWREGGYVFSKGKPQHYETILASISTKFPKCHLLKTLGYQHEGFYAFANAVFADGKIEYMNDLGLVSVDKKTYYSPAFSKIFSTQRKENDKYMNDRNFIYRENADTDFATWSRLMCEVYKVQNNGHWAVVFAMLSVFRSVVYPIDRLFTALFFIGPTASGKSQVAISVRSLFMHPDSPLFNLNSGTDAAFFTTLERFRDVAVVFEEYNDYQISDNKFQGLKAAVYDGEGKQKRKDASSKELDISQVNCAMVLLGQEAPEKDDGSLGNRCIICHVKKKESWTEEEVINFQDLKRREKNGLTNVLVQIISKRSLVEKHFQSIQRKTAKEIKEKLTADGYMFEPRIINTVSLFLAMVKFWEDYVPEMKLPFTFKEFQKIAIEKVTTQSEQISQSNRLAVFFDTISLLMNKINGIVMGRELKIEVVEALTIQTNSKETKEVRLGKDTKVLFLRINVIQQMYKAIHGNESLKSAALNMYLKDHPAYIGQIKSTRFEWPETKDFAKPDGTLEKRVVRANFNTSAIAMNYELLGCDLERFDDPSVVPFDSQPKDGEVPSLESLSMVSEQLELPV